MIGFQYLANVATLEFIGEKCVGCGMCVEVCPHQVFRFEGSKAKVVARDDCMECGACAVNCPASAIRVDAGVGCASGMINEWLAGVVGSRGGRCC
ncbi:mercury methylation ferredoxin HgcB [Geobacter sulfurreducens]|uniref:mercury methylation ferredoxin HgcB n=1 Tax=Geobacter sulfurreducens TaxID=35554 RepID=UPI000DBB879B|nr:mercury methylation ferredoxin HgcB [Geobacter sulfurreducens]BBA69940.1 Ferredoxin-2 [Geobacter sulfurreducens]